MILKLDGGYPVSPDKDVLDFNNKWYVVNKGKLLSFDKPKTYDDRQKTHAEIEGSRVREVVKFIGDKLAEQGKGLELRKEELKQGDPDSLRYLANVKELSNFQFKNSRLQKVIYVSLTCLWLLTRVLFPFRPIYNWLDRYFYPLETTCVKIAPKIAPPPVEAPVALGLPNLGATCWMNTGLKAIALNYDSFFAPVQAALDEIAAQVAIPLSADPLVAAPLLAPPPPLDPAVLAQQAADRTSRCKALKEDLTKMVADRKNLLLCIPAFVSKVRQFIDSPSNVKIENLEQFVAMIGGQGSGVALSKERIVSDHFAQAVIFEMDNHPEKSAEQIVTELKQKRLLSFSSTLKAIITELRDPKLHGRSISNERLQEFIMALDQMDTPVKWSQGHQDAFEFIESVMRWLNVDKYADKETKVEVGNSYEPTVPADVMATPAYPSSIESERQNVVSLSFLPPLQASPSDLTTIPTLFASPASVEVAPVQGEDNFLYNKTSVFTHIPKTMMCHFKRFEGSWSPAGLSASKIKTPVSIPSEPFDLIEHRMEGGVLVPSQRCKMEVSYVACHSGGLHGGHYWGWHVEKSSVTGKFEWIRHNDNDRNFSRQQQKPTTIDADAYYVILKCVSKEPVAPLAGMPAPALPVEALPVVDMPAPALPVEALPVAGMPAPALPVEALPVEALPVEALPVAGGVPPFVVAAKSEIPPPSKKADTNPAAKPTVTPPAKTKAGGRPRGRGKGGGKGGKK